ncbi:acid-sensing ion channel 4-A [Patella vulgata]|uniref:acid-sensing ion channel 4-A n=1 Tax=Patella vulgata TaxID=6465 RepID=UPI0024A7DAB1|nr:acid-sensing ion channel 4-A [Patella vulgata]
MKFAVEMEKPKDQDEKEEVSRSVGTKDMVDMYSQSATIHGVSNVGAPQIYKFRRIVWITLLLAMSISLSCIVYLQFRRYQEHPSMTIVKAEFNDELIFPAVTICNTNQYHRSRLPDDAPMLKLLYNLSEFAHIGKYLNFTKDDSNEDPVFITHHTGDYLYSFAMAAAHTLKEMFYFCSWKGRQVNCSEVFKREVTDVGVCYRFNGNTSDVLTTTTTGSRSGLRVILDIQQNFSFFSTTSQSGIKVLLNEQNESPNLSSHGLFVRPGTSTALGVRKEERIGLESPYKAFGTSYCYNTRAEGFETPLKRFANYTYTRSTCQRNCVLDHMIKQCECRHFFSPGEEDFCSLEQLEHCYIPTFTDKTMEEVVHKCIACPSRCHTISYNTQLSSADFASSFTIDYMVDAGLTQDSDYIRNNVIDLRIFYDTLTVTKTEQIPELTVQGILADLGGHMGLFLGASILSVTELAEFVALYIMEWWKRRRQKKPKSSSPSQQQMTVMDNVAMS